MKRTALTLAIATLSISAVGCGACRRGKTETVAMPVAPMCAPAPACGCDPCASGGMPAYGGATFAPTSQPVFEPMPMGTVTP